MERVEAVLIGAAWKRQRSAREDFGPNSGRTAGTLPAAARMARGGTP